MLQTNNKTSMSFLRKAGVLPVVIGSVLIFSFSPRKEHTHAPIAATKKIVLVVDAGHGGTDHGASSGSLVEKDLNLKVAKRLSELAPEHNIEVHLTRNGNETVSLAERVERSNKWKADDFISVHIDNQPGQDAGKGTFDIAINNKNVQAKKSEELAVAIYQHLATTEWTQRKAPSEKSLYVLRSNNAPSVLIEIGDIKNKEQMDHITDNTKLDVLCNAILEGVVESHKE